VDRSGLIKGSNKKGILLISTLFFIIVLIMMSVALFALTRANYADMRSFYSENEAITNAESAINIASFIIASNPVLLTINSNSVNLGTLLNTDNTNIINRINTNNYRIAIVRLSDGSFRSNDSSVSSSNFVINSNTSKIMAAMIISPRNKSISDSGAILFFGNSTSNTNTYNSNSANAVGIYFNDNQINFYFNSNNTNLPSGATYPLYTSVNNVNNNFDITGINGYRNANKYTLLLMAMGYSKVPNTNRYVVRYVDQKLANGGLLSASAYSNGTMTIDATNNVFSIADQVQYNKLIAKNFSLTLRDTRTNPNKQTLFILTNGQDSNRNGYLVAKQDSGNNFNFNGTSYNRISDLLSQGRESDVKNSIKADVSVKDKNVDTSKLRDSLANLVKSKFNDPSTYVKLPAGYYIFVDSNKIVYFPPNMSIDEIQRVLESILSSKGGGKGGGKDILADGINYYDGTRINNNNSPFKNISDISVAEYQLIINKNVKIINTTSGTTLDNLFFVSSFGKVNNNDTNNYFGNKNIQIVLGDKDNNQSAIVYGQDVAVTIDGVVKGQGTFAILNSNPSSPSTVFNSFAVNYTNNSNAFYPYRYDTTNNRWVGYNNTSISTLQNFQAGSMVVRFDQVKSSQDNLALLVDNNLYVNPIDFNIQDLDWFDHIFANTLQNWATSNIKIRKNNGNITDNETKAAFQYLFDQHKWDFNKMWQRVEDFDIKNNYTASIGSLLSSVILNKNQNSYYRYQGDNLDINTISFSTNGWDGSGSGDPLDTYKYHVLRIPVTVNNTTYTIQLTGTKDNNNKTDLKLEVFNGDIGTDTSPANSLIYTSDLFDVDRNAALGLLDSLAGTVISPNPTTFSSNLELLDRLDRKSDGGYITIGKLAWVMSAFTKGDPNIIKDVTQGVNNFNSNKLKDTSKDFANSRLEGLYQSYLNYLTQSNANNRLDISNNPNPNPNYFPFLYYNNNSPFLNNNNNNNGFVGSNFSNIQGAINNLAQNGSNSVLIVNGYSERDVKLQGMVFVGNQLKARTGANNNLLFQGNLIAGNTNITNSGNVNIMGVKNTTFQFDLNSIDLNLLNGAFIRLVPILYKQESVISK
jgi:hypothetical protein